MRSLRTSAAYLWRLRPSCWWLFRVRTGLAPSHGGRATKVWRGKVLCVGFVNLWMWCYCFSCMCLMWFVRRRVCVLCVVSGRDVIARVCVEG